MFAEIVPVFMASYGFIQISPIYDGVHELIKVCQILGVWKEKYERRGICFQQGPGFVSYQKSHNLTWDREPRSHGETQQLLYRPAASAQKCTVHSARDSDDLI